MRSSRFAPWIAAALIIGVSLWFGARRLSPRRTSAGDHFRQGWQAFQSHDAHKLQQELAALRDAGSDSQRQLLAGALALRRGEFAQALADVAPCTHAQETRLAALEIAGEAYYRLDRYREALAVMQTLVNEDTRNLPGHRWLAAMAYDLGANAEAARHLKIVAELDPQDGRPHRLLALMEKDQENHAIAADLYAESLRRQPHPADEAELRLECAECLAETHGYQSALDMLAELPATGPVLALRARCIFRLGRHEAARDLMRAAVSMSPRSLPVLLEAGTLALDLDEAQPARDLLLQAVEVDPRDYTARFKLVQAHRRLGEVAEAEKQADFARENQALRERFSKLHQAAEAAPTNASLRFELAQAALALGKPDLAKLWLKATLALDPRHAGAREMLSRLMNKAAG